MMGAFLALRNPIGVRHAKSHPPELDLPSMLMNGIATPTFRADHKKPAPASWVRRDRGRDIIMEFQI
jgi:hypothetical protein